MGAFIKLFDLRSLQFFFVEQQNNIGNDETKQKPQARIKRCCLTWSVCYETGNDSLNFINIIIIEFMI